MLIAPRASPCQGFTFTQITTPDSNTIVTGINDNNVAVGYYTDLAVNTLHGLIYQNGTLTTLDEPLANANTIALAIINSGQTLGQAQGTTNFPTAYFIYSGGSGGSFSPIGLKGVITATGGNFSLASISRLNDAGQIVGLSTGGVGVFGIPAL